MSDTWVERDKPVVYNRRFLAIPACLGGGPGGRAHAGEAGKAGKRGWEGGAGACAGALSDCRAAFDGDAPVNPHGGDYTWRKGHMFFKVPMQEERSCAAVGQFDVEGSSPFHVPLYGATEENYQELRRMLPLTVDVKFVEHTKDFLTVGAQLRQADVDAANAAAAKAE